MVFALPCSCFCHVVSLLVQVLLLLGEISICPAVPSGNAWMRPTWESSKGFAGSLQCSCSNTKTHLSVFICFGRGQGKDNRTHSTYNLPGAGERHSTRDKGHEEWGSAYAKAGSSLGSAPGYSRASTPQKPESAYFIALCSHL